MSYQDKTGSSLDVALQWGYAPINVKPEGGGVGLPTGIWLWGLSPR